MVKVELVYSPLSKEILHLRLTLAMGSTVADAIEQSGWLDSHPEIKDLPVGIFAKKVERSKVVKTGDRIEIYRFLTVCPKEKRRQRAHQRGSK